MPLRRPVAGLAEGVLQRGLVHFQDTEFLYETHLFPEEAYRSLLQEQRRALQAKIGHIRK